MSDRIYRRLVRPAFWFRGLVLPVVALAGEVAALLALRSGSHAYVWLVDWGLAASIGYLLIPLFVVMTLGTHQQARQALQTADDIEIARDELERLVERLRALHARTDSDNA